MHSVQSSRYSILVAACIAATAFTGSASAQRLSLSERVTRLEQQVNGQGGDARGNIELVNQVNALQSQVQDLQGQIEELRHELQELKQNSKDQYIDLDSRLGRLEGKQSAAPASPAAPSSSSPPVQDIQLGNPAAAQPQQAQSATPPAAPTTTSPAAPASQANAPTGAVQNPTQSAQPTGDNAAPGAAQGPDPQAAYQQAFNALKDGRYAESSRLFQAFIAQFPTDALAPNAYYWLGESYYVTENFGISLDTFQKLLATFPDSQKAPDALLKVGYCQYELKQWSQATATLNEVVRKYPGTTVANLAQGRLRAIKLEGQH